MSFQPSDELKKQLEEFTKEDKAVKEIFREFLEKNEEELANITSLINSRNVLLSTVKSMLYSEIVKSNPKAKDKISFGCFNVGINSKKEYKKHDTIMFLKEHNLLDAAIRLKLVNIKINDKELLSLLATFHPNTKLETFKTHLDVRFVSSPSILEFIMRAKEDKYEKDWDD